MFTLHNKQATFESLPACCRKGKKMKKWHSMTLILFLIILIIVLFITNNFQTTKESAQNQIYLR